MIKIYSVFGKWRKKDVTFLNSLNLNRQIEEGYFGFTIEEGVKYNKLINHYSKVDSIFNKTRPEEFNIKQATVLFSKKDLKDSENYVLEICAPATGFPQPEDGSYASITFNSECGEYQVNKTQISSFQINKMNWKKNQVAFTLNGEPDYMFVKRDFFLTVFEPLGLKSRDVIIFKTGKVSNDTVQLVVPIAESNLKIERSLYDIHDPKDSCNSKQYGVQTMDFFPPFEKEFKFLICKTKEEFFGGRKRIIINKYFCDILVKNGIIKYNSNFLIPMKTK
ncbi:hypothetical protein [Cellulophaga tyrosinoxydans]|uniref:Uncharacterized protein n=1 Tax=Cellulophaga tyrosinoxydans TaxID=504486 RepID=A0A1W1Z7I4_9FLAO|nr:hypothetical protein [Cellulophaga tyrosinoxydans]SMC44410.1 hypothetical protein SAMN05660703_1245 [Cellulophaga tyrosinoxydans]